MSGLDLHVVVPGSLDQRTGGYIYDARMVLGLRGLGWRVTVHNLEGQFPDADARARAGLGSDVGRHSRRDLRRRRRLAMGGSPEPIGDHGHRLTILSLVHHPLADETGLTQDARDRLARLERDALAACTAVLVTSRYTAGRLEDAFGVPATRIRVVVPGTDPAKPAVGPGTGAAPRLVCVASVTPRKGQDVLVAALARLRALDWSCVVAGSLTLAPAYASAVRRQAEETELADRIEFLGECRGEVLDGLYDSASLFVLPSHYEGYGMALAEALARGLPIVSTTGGAIPYTLPGDAAVLVPPGDVDALAVACATCSRTHLVVRRVGRLPVRTGASRSRPPPVVTPRDCRAGTRLPRPSPEPSWN